MTGSLEDPGELAGVGVQPLAGLIGADLAPAEVWLLRHHLACTGHSEVRLMSHVTLTRGGHRLQQEHLLHFPQLLGLLTRSLPLPHVHLISPHPGHKIIVKPKSKSPIPCPNRPQILTLSSD